MYQSRRLLVMTRDYRKELGFTNGTLAREYLTGKDIKDINWSLIEKYNERLISIFKRINETIPNFKYNHSIDELVQLSYRTIRKNEILQKLNNNGRSPESVYFVWMQGFLAATIFKSFIENKMGLNLKQNGADDLSQPEYFARKSDADFVDENKKVFVEVQSGFKGTKVDIKKSKILNRKNGYTHYIVCLDCFNGSYIIINVNDLLALPDSVWYVNTLWEGSLCYTVPEEQMKSWCDFRPLWQD